MIEAERRDEPGHGAKASATRLVGVGASAGGLDALERFFRGIPPTSGLAFVVVQHLDPHHEGMLAEILQRATPLTVVEASDGDVVAADHVYVIPPGKVMSVSGGALHVVDIASPTGPRLAIDTFLGSLAADARERSIGVVLSGMGSDGTAGLRAVAAHGGLVFAQDPTTAAFDAMPRSAAALGPHVVVAAPEELPRLVVEAAARARLPADDVAPDEAAPTDAFDLANLEAVALLLRAHTGHDFSLYKPTTVSRRVERRMNVHRIDRLDGYVQFLQTNPQELELLFKELLIGVTRFFRDADVWEQLRDDVLPELLAARRPGTPIRVWVPGCATGEEAYSLAIVMTEVLRDRGVGRTPALQVFATDLDADAIDSARAGMFPESIAADVSPERLERFFSRSATGYRVTKSIREVVIFAPQNVAADPPFSRVDLISCRNLLIYLMPELQRRLIPLFHRSLNPGGVLFLGGSETLGEMGHLFASLPGPGRIYRRVDGLVATQAASLPVAGATTFAARHAPLTRAAPDLQSEAERLLVHTLAPPAVLATEQGDIVYVSGRTGRYLEPATGKANLNVLAMVRDRVRHELSSSFRRALECPGTPVRRVVRVGEGPALRAVELRVEVLTEPATLRGLVLIVFTDVAVTPPDVAERSAGSGADVPAAAMAEDLDDLRRELLELRGERQLALEEAESANEELQSTNEELQSTNEELTTSREEMQSMNEELQTLNLELLAKVDDVSRLNSDLHNLVDSAEIATVFLDAALRVRLFTAGATSLFRLIPGDVGRPITDIATGLPFADLAGLLAGVVSTGAPRDLDVVDADGRSWHVRVAPYRTIDGDVDGVSFAAKDITAEEALRAQVRAADDRAAASSGPSGRCPS